MQIGNKKTALKDNAALYNHESDKLTDREKMKSLKGKKKWVQFRDYYLLKIVAVLAVIAFVISLVFTIFRKRPESVFYAAISDYPVLEEVEKLKADFDEYISLDPETQATTFDNSYYFKTNEFDAIQKFTVYMYVGEISVAVMPESVFMSRAKTGLFKPMSEVLTTELYLKYEDRFAMCGTLDDEGNMIENSEKVYGLYLNGCGYFTEADPLDPMVVAVCGSWQNNEICTDFIEFLFK